MFNAEHPSSSLQMARGKYQTLNILRVRAAVSSHEPQIFVPLRTYGILSHRQTSGSQQNSNYESENAVFHRVSLSGAVCTIIRKYNI